MTGRNGIGAHQSAAALSTDWLTPPWILESLGGADSFDLDPCASLNQPWPTARQHYTIRDNGLMLPWGEMGKSRIWLNPPYSSSVIARWLGRMASHDCGTALIFARTETAAFFEHIWERAAAVLFIKGRLHFHVGEERYIASRGDLVLGGRAPTNSGGPSVLIAYGQRDTDILAACAIEGQFVPLRIPRAVVVEALSPTWREVVDSVLRRHPGPVPLAELYRAIAAHPKAKRNPHFEEKVRQVLQRGEGDLFSRAGKGLWETRRNPNG